VEGFWFGILLPWAMTILNELLIGFRTFYFYLFVWYGWVFGFRLQKGRRQAHPRQGRLARALLFSSLFSWGLYPAAINWKEAVFFPFSKKEERQS
jgi:hypothetical protein